MPSHFYLQENHMMQPTDHTEALSNIYLLFWARGKTATFKGSLD
jgi:flagellar biosynthesis regulator FlbT